MSLQDILDHQCAICHFDPIKLFNTVRVHRCLELAVSAPASSNMQLRECYRVTQPKTLKELTHALLDQRTAETAQQMVVFVTRRDRHRAYTRIMKAFEIESVVRNNPKEKQARRIKKRQVYYDSMMPLFYIRFFWLLGLFRKLLAQIIGLFRPVVKQVTEDDTCITVYESYALVVQAFVLVTNKEGYDTCPIEGFDNWLVKETLGLPYHTEINMVIICGVHLLDGVRSERYRFPFEQVYHQV